MLVLSRKEGEKIMIGDDVRITIVRISSKSIRIGIEAPDGKSVVRDEILNTGTKEPTQLVVQE